MDRKEVVELLRQMANGPAAVYGTDALDAFAAAADLLAADDRSAEAIASAAASKLFSNALGDVAERLVLEVPGVSDAGGWCRGAVVEVIRQAILRQLPPEPDHG